MIKSDYIYKGLIVRIRLSPSRYLFQLVFQNQLKSDPLEFTYFLKIGSMFCLSSSLYPCVFLKNAV